MKIRILAATVLMAAAVVLGVQAPAHADEPFTFEVTNTKPRLEYVVVDFKLTNTTGEKVNLTYKRLPDGSASRQLTLYPEGRAASESDDVHLPCSSTSKLEFTYWLDDGAESTLTKEVTTPACATAGPDGQPPDSDSGGKDDDGIDIHFASFFKWLGKWTAIVVGSLVALVLLVYFGWRRFTSSRS